MSLPLFANEKREIIVAPGAILLEGFATNYAESIINEINNIALISPLRKMLTPNGRSMSVATTNCGQFGWVSDRGGYRYESIDPKTQKAWPLMPSKFLQLALEAAEKAGYKNFIPNVCLINQYAVGTKMGLHQDNDEQDIISPIVSVSLGLPATFLFGGQKRQDKTQKIPLDHGDVFVFGGKSRLAFHGVAPLKADEHHLLGNKRINLTFRRAIKT